MINEARAWVKWRDAGSRKRVRGHGSLGGVFVAGHQGKDEVIGRLLRRQACGAAQLPVESRFASGELHP